MRYILLFFILYCTSMQGQFNGSAEELFQKRRNTPDDERLVAAFVNSAKSSNINELENVRSEMIRQVNSRAHEWKINEYQSPRLVAAVWWFSHLIYGGDLSETEKRSEQMDAWASATENEIESVFQDYQNCFYSVGAYQKSASGKIKEEIRVLLEEKKMHGPTEQTVDAILLKNYLARFHACGVPLEPTEVMDILRSNQKIQKREALFEQTKARYNQQAQSK